MDAIKKILSDAIDAVPKAILRKLLTRKIKEAGIEMPSDMLDAFIKHIISKNDDEFVWKDAPAGIATSIKLTFTDEDSEEIDTATAKILAEIPDAVLKATEVASNRMFEHLRETWKTEYATQRYEVDEFRDRLEAHWGEGLGYLRMLLTCCREIGHNISKRHAKSKSKKHMHCRWVLVRLHTRACQVTDEILCLMENGFADGAMARWRTLYELSVVASLIADGDEDLAERYILHDAIEVKRQADNYDETQVPLGFPAIKKRERSAIEREYKAVTDRFGPTFAYPYGWAAKHLKHKRPTFKELQVAADRAGMSSYYKLASFNVHAGARSLFFNLSSMGNQALLLAGRSNAGLVEPGERTAHTLVLITSLYVGDTMNFERIAELNCLLHLRDATTALEHADQRLRRAEQARQKRLVEERTRRTIKRAHKSRA